MASFDNSAFDVTAFDVGSFDLTVTSASTSALADITGLLLLYSTIKSPEFGMRTKMVDFNGQHVTIADFFGARVRIPGND